MECMYIFSCINTCIAFHYGKKNWALHSKINVYKKPNPTTKNNNNNACYENQNIFFFVKHKHSQVFLNYTENNYSFCKNTKCKHKHFSKSVLVFINVCFSGFTPKII